MNKFQEIKRVLGNREVVQKYLGLPEKHTSTGNWYKSPFRGEKTASFCVSDKGIHDFGSSEHYDIISFVQRYFNTTAYQALEIICSDFGISIGNEYENKESLKRLKKKREEEKRAKEIIENWFNSQLVNICNEAQKNQRCIDICERVPNKEVLDLLYKEQVRLEYYFEILVNANEQDKINLYLEEQNDKRRKNENIRQIRST